MDFNWEIIADTHISMSSNSSRFRCLLRNAAARFLTSLASRLVRPVTSGGTKSFVLTHVRGFLAVEGAAEGVADGRFDALLEPFPLELDADDDGTEGITGDADENESV